MASQSISTNDTSPASPYPIAVIIPTYNREDAILTCLSHLERQSFRDFEVVVVDDGSTDSTAQRLAEYQRGTCLRLRCIRQENGGPGKARNTAIAALEAPICLMIGDDIFASPDLVFTHLELHRRRPEIEVAGLGLTRWCDSGQTVTPFMRWLDESGVQFAYHDLLRGVPPSWKHFYTSNLSLKTQLLREDPFDESFSKVAAEDLELGYRLERKWALEVDFIPEALAHHLHPTSFQQSCKRNYRVGESIRLLHEVWPETAEPVQHAPFRQGARKFVVSHPALLPPLTFLADVVTRFWCPNLLMLGALSCYYNLGYQNSTLSRGSPKLAE